LRRKGFLLRAKQDFGMALPSSEAQREAHPMDVIEEVAHANDWTFERAGDDEVAMGIAGKCAEYNIAFSWLADHEALHLSCSWEVKTGLSRFNEIVKLLAAINEQMLLGHFDYWQNEGIIMFRQTLVLAGGVEPTDRQVEAILDNAIQSCETYHPAFQYVIWSGLPAREALDNVLFETVGSA
jgi:hypothetical protein